MKARLNMDVEALNYKWGGFCFTTQCDLIYYGNDKIQISYKKISGGYTIIGLTENNIMVINKSEEDDDADDGDFLIDAPSLRFENMLLVLDENEIKLSVRKNKIKAEIGCTLLINERREKTILKITCLAVDFIS